MKNSFNPGICALSLMIATVSFGQQTATAPAPTPYTIVHREAHERTWQRTTYEVLPSGQVVPQVQSYDEIATGLCHPGPDGQWLDSQEAISLLPSGAAAATEGQHQVYFPIDLYDGTIELDTPDGLQIQSRPVALCYDDGTSVVLISSLTNSVGSLVASNQIIYPGAFTGPGIDADLRYTYRKSGFEQDVVLKQQLPPPEAFGLDSTNANLELVTEFFNAPEPKRSALTTGPNGLTDATLSFGSMKMIRGNAFSIGAFSATNSQTGGIAVCKSWEHMDNETCCLVEAVPYERIGPELSNLPAFSGTVTLRGKSVNRASLARLLPPTRPREPERRGRRIATASRHYQEGVVLDYQEVLSETNFTFQGDTTYLVTGPVSLWGTTTIEGGSVVKYAVNNNPGSYIAFNGPVNCKTASYCKAIFTASDDNSVGQPISGSSGNPSGTYAVWALWYNNPPYSITLHNLEINYSSWALSLLSGSSNVIRDVQFLDNDGCVISYGTTNYLENVLMYDTPYTCIDVFDGSCSIVENLTADDSAGLWYGDTGSSFAATNCLFVGMGALGAPFVGANNGTNSSDSGVFQTFGAGSHYLPADSSYRGQGTTNIDPTLLAELRQKTTQPPIVYDRTDLSGLGTLGPQAPRDTNSAPDIGFHYDSLDYLLAGCDLETNLIVTAGTAIGYYFDYDLNNGIPDSLTLNDGANLSFQGAVTQPCIVARTTMVQEGGSPDWYKDNKWTSSAITLHGGGGPAVPFLSANFTKWSSENFAGYIRDAYSDSGQGTLANCEFYNTGVATYNMQYLYFTNCLFYRASSSFFDQDYAISFTFENCTFYNGYLFYGRYNGSTGPPYFYDAGLYSSFWLIENCSFDGTGFNWADPLDASSANTFMDYNSYNTNNLSWQTYPSSPVYGANEIVGPKDLMVTNYNWQTNWFGDFYLPPDSPLIQRGSTTANSLGLYWFTTQTNQTPETNATVDIGYHFVATDTNGNPLDTYLPNVPNYISEPWGTETMTVGIGDDTVGQCDVPYGLTNVIQVAAGRGQSLALKTDGTVVAWGENIYGQGSVPTDISGVAMISAGYYDDYALLTNGTVKAWGFDNSVYPMTQVPTNLTNVTTISAGGLHTLALCSNGTVASWGYESGFGETGVPAGLTGVTAISAGYEFNLAVSNGFVILWGADEAGQCDAPTNLSNVVDVAAGPYHSLALLQNGTVVAWGDDIYGETDVPDGLSNVVAIAAGGDPDEDVAYSMALKSDGTVVAWGYDDPSAPVGGLDNVISIAAGNFHALALRTGPPTPVITLEPVDEYQVTNAAVTFKSRGAGLYGVTYQWQFNGVNISGATSGALTLNDVGPSQLGTYDVVVTDNAGMGSIVSSNANLYYVTPPLILSESPLPTNQIVIFETNVTLSVTATAPGTNDGFQLSYQWQLNGINIAGANGPSYGFTATATTFGTYSVIVSNAVGSTSAAWQMTVVYPGGLLISQQPTNQYQVAGGSLSFACNAVSSNSIVLYQWQFDGMNILGATNATLTLTNVQAAQQGSYDAIVNDEASSLASSNAYFTLVTPPTINSETLPYNQFALYGSNLTLDVSASAPGQTNGFPLAYQWQFDGTGIPGQTSSNYVFGVFNSGTYSVVVTNAAGSTDISWQVNLVYPGDIVGWGSNSNGQLTASSQLTNVISLAAGEAQGLVALDSGSVSNWGSYWTGASFIPVTPPPIITNALAVAAGSRHDLALLQNGTVAAWGLNDFEQTNVPPDATNVTAIAAGGQQSLALLQNGTVVQWGQTNAPISVGLTNVTAIAAGTNFCLALLSNSTVVAWGANNFGQTNVPAGLSNVVAIAAGGAHALALEQNGTVVAWGDNTYGETNVPAGLSNVMNIAAGDNHSIALENNGTVIAWGDNTFGQTNASGGLSQIKYIAGGGYFSLAAVFSPTVMYPTDVSQDLLLIYNTNSIGSTTVENYYLQNRPMVGGANVLGIGCTNNEITTGIDFTNQILMPYLNWLNQNPTKHPEYLILFLDTSRVENGGNEAPSVQYQLRTDTVGIEPFVTSINMNGVNGTNDCIAYIYKVRSFGTNYSPGRLVISASAGGYGNTNYVVDDMNNLYCGDPWVPATTNGLIEAGVSQSAIQFLTGCEDTGDTGDLPHLTNAANVAGYISWGFHSSLRSYYATNGVIRWSGNSGWWIIRTEESFNGQRAGDGGNFLMWFASNAFGGTNYSNTPIGGPTYVAEPTAPVTENDVLFYLWASGKNLAICCWTARDPGTPPYYQVVGDPFVTR